MDNTKSYVEVYMSKISLYTISGYTVVAALTFLLSAIMHTYVDHTITKRTLVTLVELCNTHKGALGFSADSYTATVYCQDGEKFSMNTTNQEIYDTKKEK